MLIFFTACFRQRCRATCYVARYAARDGAIRRPVVTLRRAMLLRLPLRYVVMMPVTRGARYHWRCYVAAALIRRYGEAL